VAVLLRMEGKGNHTCNGTSNQQVTTLSCDGMGWDGMMVTAG
jgi:hypothetical protein